MIGSDLNNARSMRLIETSCMIVCVDEPLPAELFNRRENAAGQNDDAILGRRDDTNRAVQMINGGGSKFNSANRWYDKSVQVNLTFFISVIYTHSTKFSLAVYLNLVRALSLIQISSICLAASSIFVAYLS